MMELVDLKKITEILKASTTIAVVGLSPKAERPSNMVARYLIEAGYRVVPVNPGHQSILGLTCYADLQSIPVPVDIVDIFRKSSDVPPIVASAVEIGASTVWMQEGVIHHEAAELARSNNIYVVMDRCIKVDHFNLLA